jgi:riboflavin synthase
MQSEADTDLFESAFSRPIPPRRKTLQNFHISIVEKRKENVRKMLINFSSLHRAAGGKLRNGQNGKQR